MKSYDATMLETGSKKPKMGDEEAIPNTLYYGLPVFVLGTCALLLSSHISVGASTEVNGHAPLGALVPHTASSDNLFSGVRRLADAHAWLMVVIVAVMSGIWPYAKCLLSFSVVVLGRKRVISLDTCRSSLKYLEIFGKYSWADVIMIVFNLSIFTIHTRNWAILNVDHLQVNLYMSLHYGAVALVFALLLSTMLTHWAAYEISRKVPRWDVISSGKKDAASADEEQPLLSERDSGSVRPLTPRLESLLGLSRWVHLAAALLGVAALCIGSSLTMLTIERTGFFANLIRKEKRNVYMSVFTTTSGMTDVFLATGSPAIRFFQAVFLILAFIAPCMELLLLAAGVAFTWTSVSRSFQCFTAAEVAHSFGGVEVLLFTCFACLFELQNVVKFNMGSECDPFKDLMNNKMALSLAGLGDAVSDTCFKPEATLGPGWFVMFGYIALRIVAWRWAHNWQEATGEIVHAKEG